MNKYSCYFVSFFFLLCLGKYLKDIDKAYQNFRKFGLIACVEICCKFVKQCRCYYIVLHKFCLHIFDWLSAGSLVCLFFISFLQIPKLLDNVRLDRTVSESSRISSDEGDSGGEEEDDQEEETESKRKSHKRPQNETAEERKVGSLKFDYSCLQVFI